MTELKRKVGLVKDNEDSNEEYTMHITSTGIIYKKAKSTLDLSEIVYECKLSKYNGHARDKNIAFNEEHHKYTIEGVDKKILSGIIGVTTLIHQYFPKFDDNDAIKKMRNGRNWNSKNPLFGKTDEEIKKCWKDNGDLCSKQGTKMHAFLESYFEHVLELYSKRDNHTLETFFTDGSYMLLKEENWPEHVGDDILIKSQVYTFLREYMHYTPYRTEWRLYDKDYLLAGTPDILFEDTRRPFKETKELHLMDWKRVKNLKDDNPYEKALQVGIFDHLDNCNRNIYNIQLNLYKRMLEKNYGVKIMSMTMILFNPETGYRKNIVPVMSKEIDMLLRERSKVVTNILSWYISQA